MSRTFYMKRFIVILLLCINAGYAGTLTLARAQEILFNNNRDVQIAESRFLKSLNEVSEARSALYPLVETYSTFSYQSKQGRLVTDLYPSEEMLNIYKLAGISNPGPTHIDEPIGSQDRFELGLDFSYPLFTGYTRTSAIKSAEARSSIQCLTSTLTKEILSVKLGIMFFQWELSVEKIKAQQTFIEQVSEYMVQVTNLYRGGVIPRSRVLEATARLESAKYELINSQSCFDSIRIEILDFLRAGDTIDNPGKSSFELSDAVLKSLPRTYRPEILILDSSMSVMRLNEKALKGRRMPWISALAGYRVGRPGINMGGEELVDWGIIGLQLRWTIYDGQKNASQMEQVRLELDIMRKEREKQLAQWDKQASVLKLQLEKAHRMKSVAELSLKAAEELTEELKNAQSAGVASSVEYLNALAAVSQEKYRCAQAETFRKSMSLQLAFALGEDIKF
jgi:outer membrane protein TolC